MANSETAVWIITGSPATITPPATTSGQVTLKHLVHGAEDTVTASASGFPSATLKAKK